MSARIRWTTKQTEMLCALWQVGMTASAIARMLGLSRSAVAAKANRLGLSRERRVGIGGGGALRHGIAVARAIPFAPPAGRCQYPVGEVGDPKFRFCGDAARLGSPYCEGHHARCYERANPDAEIEAGVGEAAAWLASR